MLQDYRLLNDDQLEALEKQCLRTIVQALQEYSAEARQLFENTPINRGEVIVLAEDTVQYALEVAESYPINKRFAGFIDYKRVRWMSTPFGLLPQVLLVDAKASKEANRDTLQQSQLPMDAEFRSDIGAIINLPAGVPPDLPINTFSGVSLAAVTTSVFIHFHYSDITNAVTAPYRTLHTIYVLMLPHQRLKHIYNPDPDTTFFGQGKHSPARGEAPRIRVYFARLRQMCPWRLQELRYSSGSQYSQPTWRDSVVQPSGTVIETNTPFEFIGR
jgi:hypothetical protein